MAGGVCRILSPSTREEAVLAYLIGAIVLAFVVERAVWFWKDHCRRCGSRKAKTAYHTDRFSTGRGHGARYGMPMKVRVKVCGDCHTARVA